LGLGVGRMGEGRQGEGRHGEEENQNLQIITFNELKVGF